MRRISSHQKELIEKLERAAKRSAILWDCRHSGQPEWPEGEFEEERIIREALSQLNPKEEQVIRLRFGIGESRKHSLKETGEWFRQTKSRVQQIEMKALQKLMKLL